MNTAGSNDPRIQAVRVTDDEIVAHLADGRVISVPLAWSWRLSEATPKQRANFRLVGAGQGVHWPSRRVTSTVPGPWVELRAVDGPETGGRSDQQPFRASRAKGANDG